jgi:regulator of ribonuclease activity A
MGAEGQTRQVSGKLFGCMALIHAKDKPALKTIAHMSPSPPSSTSPRIDLGAWQRLAAPAARVRTTVFLEEQGIDPALEWDEADASALHAVAWSAGEQAVGTARLLQPALGMARIGRMAVLPAWRGRGLGLALLRALMAAARARGDQHVMLHAQLAAAGFYRRAGYEAQGEVFDEAGIPHIEMHCALNSQPEGTPMSAAPDFSTCDLCDLHKGDTSGSFRVLPPVFREFGGRARFAGPVVTLQCFEDNSLVKTTLDQPGLGRVLVVDGAGSLRRALVGGNIAAAAARNGWAGVVVDGCVRDVAELAACEVGIRALAAMPLPTEKRQQGVADVPVRIQGVWVRPGEWLYADADGMVVMPSAA